LESTVGRSVHSVHVGDYMETIISDRRDDLYSAVQ